MIAQTVTCPSCKIPLDLNATPPVGGVTTTCPKCGEPIPIHRSTEVENLQPTAAFESSPVLAHETVSPVAGPGSREEATDDIATRTATPSVFAFREFPFLAPPQQPDELGRLGPYRVLGLLGAGGMGAVFRAEDPVLRRQIALKVMLPQHAIKPTAKDRFLREARAQAAVEHDHIITIHQVGEEGDVPFIAMPLLKGQTLADVLKANPAVPVGDAIQIAGEMAAGLAAAHEQNLVHRDIKPANVWLEGRSRRVKILDFGLARTEGDDAGAEPVTQEGAIIGTPAYMSPEQAQGESLDARTDLFSLGIVLYQMLTGFQPFTGKNTTAILMTVVSHSPPRPAELNPEVPAELDRLTMQLLAKSASDRPVSAEAVAEALCVVRASLNPRDPITAVFAPPAVVDPRETLASTDPDSEPPLHTVAVNLTTVSQRPRNRSLASRTWLLTVSLLASVAVVVLAAGIIKIKSKDGSEAVSHGGKAVGQDPKNDPVLPGDDRPAAEWALSLGGMVVTNRQEKFIKTVAELPKGPLLLTGLALQDANPSELAHFKDCKNLTGLWLGGTQVSDEGLANFKDCKKLTNLGLSCPQVTNVGVVYFKDCKNLTHIDLGTTQVSDAGVAQFKECNNLAALGLAATQVSDAGLLLLKDCNNLMELDLSGCTKVTDIALAQLKECKNLTSLKLQKTKVTEAGIAEFAKALPGCEIQSNGGVLEPRTINDRKAAEWALGLGGKIMIRLNEQILGLNAVAELPNEPFLVTVLMLPGSQATDAGLAHFKGCKYLTYFDLSNTPVTNAGLAHFKNCKNLTGFALQKTQVGDAGLAHLKDCKELTTMNIGFTDATDEGLTYFRDCKNLTGISLFNTKVTDAGLAHFKECKTLESLNLSNTRVTDGGLAYFKDCKHLKMLNLYGCTQVSDEGIAYFKDCKDLTELALYDTQVSDDGLAYFKDCHNLTSLWLGGRRVSNAGLAHFKDCKQLEEINLTNCTRVSNAGLEHFRGCKNLARLDLNWCTQVSNAGVAHFIDCKTLSSINLLKTKVNATGIDELKKALPQCKIEWDDGVIDPKK